MEDLRIIRDSKGIDDLITYLADKDFVAYDTETTGLETDCKIIGICISAETNVGYYVILYEWIPDVKGPIYSEEPTRVLEGIFSKEVLKEQTRVIQTGKLVANQQTLSRVPSLLNLLKTKDLIMHNSPFDCSRTFVNFKIELIKSVHTDTMELAHILNENKPVGLKELAFTEFGASSTDEQTAMKASIVANGGKITKDCYELYKADAELIARYGAKDAILTFNLFSRFVPDLFDQKLDKFFYEEESMPLMRGPTYTMNTVGLKVDVNRLRQLEKDLQLECLRLKEEINREVHPLVKEKWPGTKPKDTFNMNSNEQLSWLLFIKLGNEFFQPTKKGKEIAKSIGDNRIPYNPSAKKMFIQNVLAAGKKPEKYFDCSANTLRKFEHKYQWLSKLLKLKKSEKMLNTYVIGIQDRMKYGIIHPSFLQHGTTSGRYSSRSPNFQNLPRDDKQVKSCIVPRDGKVFVAADYSQLEPRVFASFAQDDMLLLSFAKGDKEDFYSVIGISVFNKWDCSADKDASNYFGTIHKPLRQIAKGIALAATYGTTPNKLASILVDECNNPLSVLQCRKIIDDYFDAYPGVKKFMLSCHDEVKKHGVVKSTFGRPRRILLAKNITKMYGNKEHGELPYEIRKYLNLSVNHKIQSSAASIVNRSAIALEDKISSLDIKDCNLVLQVHDELVVECRKEDAEKVAQILKESMENTCKLNGVALLAEPKIGNNLGELK